MTLASVHVVQILEVRFYPRSKAVSTFVCVGKVICDGKRVSIESGKIASRAVQPFQGDALLSKLQFLVDSAVPDTCGELLHLRSDFWSFVQVEHSS